MSLNKKTLPTANFIKFSNTSKKLNLVNSKKRSVLTPVPYDWRVADWWDLNDHNAKEGF